MDFIIGKDNFLKVLQRVQGIVEKRNTMPILANVLIRSNKNNIEVMATDLEISIKDTCDATVKNEGDITVNARKLFEIVKGLPDGDVEVSVKDDKLKIKQGKVKFNLVGISSKEFPAFPVIEEDKLVRVDPEVLKEMIDKTSFAVSTDETRYNINGFYMEREGNTVKTITTDGHRLAMIIKEEENINIPDNGVILPKKGVNEVRKILEEKEGTFFFGIGANSVTLKKDDTIVNTRLIEGEFPDYKQVVPKSNDKEVVIEKIIFLEALKRMSILSTDRIKGVKFSFSTGKLIMTSSSPDIGDADEEINIKYDNEDMEIAFNARYFIDALEAVDNDNVTILLKDSLSPAILKTTGTAECVYIIMPMRL